MKTKTIQEKTLLSSIATELAPEIEIEILSHTTRDDVLSAVIREKGLRLWLLNFIDIVVCEWTTVDNQISSDILQSSRVVSKSRARFRSQDSNAFLKESQTKIWRSHLQDLIINYRNLYRAGPFVEPCRAQHQIGQSISTSSRHDVLHVGKGWLVANPYLPRKAHVALCLSFFTLPSRWETDLSKERSLRDHYLRSVEMSVKGHQRGTVQDFICSIITGFIPESFLESLPSILEDFQKLLLRPPAQILSANPHLSSDQFLILLTLLRLKGTKVLLSQHGGLYGQGAIPVRAAEFEQLFADVYLHWGWCTAPNAVKVPAQITMWKRQRRRSRNYRHLVLVTDCTYRYSRRPWPCDEENRRYRAMLLSSYASIPSRIAGHVIVRLHHDHDKYDVSHSEMWRNAYPGVQLDNGLEPMNKLRKSARLLVSMSLGTSEIEQFARNIPTILRIDPVVHALRESCKELFADMEKLGLVHWSDESFSAFLDENWDDIDAWWTSTPVSEVVGRYLDRFGYQSKKPFREFRATIKVAAAN